MRSPSIIRSRIPSTGSASARARLQQLQALLDDNKLDAIVYPHQKRLVVPIGESQTDRNGFLASITGFPAIVVPAGFSSGGVPIGVEFLGRAFAEPTLLKLAYSYEQGTQNRRPPASAP